MGYPLGTDVGFSPQTHVVDLERSIVCSIKTVFTDADIAKVMEQAEIPYTPPSNCGTSPTVSPSPTSPPAPQMTLTKSANMVTAQSGDTVTYTINYSNTGSVDILTMVIADIVPSGTSYVQNSASAGGVFDGTQVTWNIALVKQNVSGSVTFQVKVN
ncbi:MAG TPA: DUF11 domain-containing protein [Patescibacteria group bacterium]|nr:DUF11 domain-containing protein [Patescibacteria group bacterium]